MNRRLSPTLTDYVVTAINPVLVMVVVGSLVYFLQELVYSGQFPARLQFSLTMFVMSAVLIARIAMEDGYERAALFGLPLAVVVGLAMDRYINSGWAFNLGFMALIWWCSDRLTWDCTLVDESEVAAGEGLLQTVGIDRPEINAAGGEGHAATAPPAKQRAEKALNRWEKLLHERRGRPHAPGVWVVYFAMASLPIFGVGQLFISAGDTARRRYAFGLLCAYVAGGLGLLLTTSFLSLRRYLRQRRLEMPALMAGAWLGTGGALVLALLVLSALLPRPNPEYSLAQLSGLAGSTTHDSSEYAVGKEGVRDEQASSAPGEEHGKDKGSTPRDKQDKTADGSDQTTESTKGARESDSASGTDQGTPSKTSSRENPQGNSKEPKASDDHRADDAAKGKPADRSKPDQADRNQNEQSPDKQSPPPQREPASSDRAANRTDAPEVRQSPPASSLEITSIAAAWLAPVIQWLFYGALAMAALYWAWRLREQLMAIVQKWLAGWADFWRSLWREPADVPEGATAAAAKRQPPRPFAAFDDPFLSGQAARLSPGELIQYTFAAVEAWAREHDAARRPDETVHEFARSVGARQDSLAKDSRVLADLVSRAAYAQGPLPAGSTDHLARLWQSLRSAA